MIVRHEFNPDTIPFLLQKRAVSSPSDVAYSFPQLNQHYAWGTLWNETQALAKGLLQLGIKKGDSVALLMTGRAELIISMFAIASIGAIIVPLNAYSKKDEIKVFLESSKPTAMIVGTEGHHMNYPSMLLEIIAECRSNHIDDWWIPDSIFVVDGDAELPSPLRPFSELTTIASETSEEMFIARCKAVTVSDPLILLYTSGTTAFPKGVIRTTAAFLSTRPTNKKTTKTAALLGKVTDIIARRFSLISLLPLYHLGGFGTIFTNLKVCNVRIVLLSYFHPLHAIKAVEQEACKIMVGTPYMVQRILSASQDDLSGLSSLIGISFTSAAVSSSLLRKVNEKLKLLFFMVTYGSSEAGSVANGTCFNKGHNNIMLTLLIKLLIRSRLLSGAIDLDKFLTNDYSLAGKIDRGVEVKIIHPETGETLPNQEHGEVVVRSYRVMKYMDKHHNLSCFTSDGWFKTGDLGYLDDSHILTISGRLRRLISRGGEKISPVEIENLLLQNNDIEEAFVLGIPDDLYGEQVCACVVARQGSAATAESLKNILAVHLSAFKIPRYVVFLPELPLAPTGKISVGMIKELAMKQLEESKIHA